MDYSKLAASAPLNKTAATVTSRGGSWGPAVNIIDHWDEPPEMKPITNEMRRQEGFENFEGREFGRLKVIGLMRKPSKKAKASWVCRCKCGDFCTRSTKSLKVAMRGGNCFVDRCGRCDYDRRLREGWTPENTNVRLTYESAWKTTPKRRA